VADLERLLRRERAPADWLAEVTGCTLPARPVLVQLLRERQGLSAEAAEAAAERLPVCLGGRLTRGQAEDLLVHLRRQGVKARLREA
jgi:hypothetical protein